MSESNQEEILCNEIGMRLQICRMLLGIPVNEMGRITNTTPQQIRNLEKGKINFDIFINLVKILREKYGISPDHLICGAGNIFAEKGPLITDEFFQQHLHLFPPIEEPGISNHIQPANVTINLEMILIGIVFKSLRFLFISLKLKPKEDSMSKGVIKTFDDFRPGPVSKICLLINSIFYFIGCVIIIIENRSYRLVAILHDEVLHDQIYISEKGAKIAFAKLFRDRAWDEKVKPEWSFIYTPDEDWLDQQLNILEKNKLQRRAS